MARYFLTLSYNGINFNGWQIQDNTPNTVEQVLEEKLSMLLKEKIDLVGCGRTDTGVNAKNFIAHFDSLNPSLIRDKQQWVYKFNTLLPQEISVHDIRAVKPSAHARFDATSRVYYYHISQKRDPFRDPFTWYVYGQLDFELMNKAAQHLLGEHDFTSFSKTNSQSKTNICTIRKAVWQKSTQSEWRFTIVADRFLRGMVRAVVGTLVNVGKNRISIQEFKDVIAAKDRKLAGPNAPPNALFLTGISYPNDIFI
jgi:tRNA pseudouridine38-40 synthase